MPPPPSYTREHGPTAGGRDSFIKTTFVVGRNYRQECRLPTTAADVGVIDTKSILPNPLDHRPGKIRPLPRRWHSRKKFFVVFRRGPVRFCRLFATRYVRHVTSAGFRRFFDTRLVPSIGYVRTTRATDSERTYDLRIARFRGLKTKKKNRCFYNFPMAD